MRKEKKNDEGKNNMYKQIDQSMMMKMMKMMVCMSAIGNAEGSEN